MPEVWTVAVRQSRKLNGYEYVSLGEIPSLRVEICLRRSISYGAFERYRASGLLCWDRRRKSVRVSCQEKGREGSWTRTRCKGGGDGKADGAAGDGRCGCW